MKTGHYSVEIIILKICIYFVTPCNIMGSTRLIFMGFEFHDFLGKMKSAPLAMTIHFLTKFMFFTADLYRKDYAQRVF